MNPSCLFRRAPPLRGLAAWDKPATGVAPGPAAWAGTMQEPQP